MSACTLVGEVRPRVEPLWVALRKAPSKRAPPGLLPGTADVTVVATPYIEAARRERSGAASYGPASS
jgi:hypothetical protein